MKRFWVQFFATTFGSGYIPLAPGTWGSLVTLAIVYAFSSFSFPLYALTTLTVILIAIPIASQAEIYFGEHDCGKITIDEVAGQMVTFLLVPKTFEYLLVGFFLFRWFDITKPKPVRYFESLPRGWGIVMDDVMAGVYAALCLVVLEYTGMMSKIAASLPITFQ